MRKVMTVIVGVVLVSAVAVMANCGSCEGDKPAACSASKTACKIKQVYACPGCKVAAAESGKCSKCDKELAAMRVLGCAQGMVCLCACEAGCKCKGAAGAAKCGCGKDVVKIPVKAVPGCGACPASADAPAACSAK